MFVTELSRKYVRYNEAEKNCAQTYQGARIFRSREDELYPFTYETVSLIIRTFVSSEF